MSGANSPEILAAYDAVRSDKDPTNWLLISYASAVGDKLTYVPPLLLSLSPQTIYRPSNPPSLPPSL